LNINQQNNIKFLLKKSEIKFNEPMSRHSTFGIGGPAECLVYPHDSNELSILLRYIDNNNIPIFFIGSGSNILFYDKRIQGFIISLKKTFKKFSISKKLQINAQSGVMLGTLIKNAIKLNAKGLESLIGVPGTLGGALIMNAGAFGNEISNYLQLAHTMTLDGSIKTYKKSDIDFKYRYSSFPKNEILLDAIFQCIEGEPVKIKHDREKASRLRRNNQPLKYRSAGSIFKNPSKDLAAGYLIDQAGLKGIEKGDACISNKHANFIINNDSAKASDVLYLIQLIKNTVQNKFNVNLELEVKLIGFPKIITDKSLYS